jgi:hypothetical protein
LAIWTAEEIGEKAARLTHGNPGVATCWRIV